MTYATQSPVWIDTDMGFDDLAAILMVAAHRPIAGLSLVAGNTGLPQVAKNAMASAETFGWTFPIHTGAAVALSGELVTADYVLGEDGMPGIGRKLPDPKGRAETGGIEALTAYLDAGHRDVLALGPLTNLARAVEARPDLAASMRLIWMGGSAGPGNHTSAAEFNAAVDPEALALLTASGVTVEMVDLEACRQVTITLDDLPALRAIPGDKAELLADLLEGYIRIAANGRRPMALYDPVAAAALIAPETVQFARARLDMELRGSFTRGMTVVEWRSHKAEPNALVSISADGAAIKALMMSALICAAEGQDR